MSYGVTVLEGETKSVYLLDLPGRGKYNESSWCEKRTVTSRLSVDWRKHTKKIIKKIRNVIVVFVEQKHGFVMEKKIWFARFLWIVVRSQSDVNLDRDSKWRNPWSREIDRINAILSKIFEFQGIEFSIYVLPIRRASLSRPLRDRERASPSINCF
jgi:hypothetical protein